MAEQSPPTATTDATDPTPLEQVQPPDYRKLRQLAESALSVANESVDFFFTHDGTLKRRAPDHVVQNNEILVPTFDAGKFPANGISFSITDQLIGGYTPPPGVAHAAFWSDAAVQKFLFSFVASSGGHSASRVLTLLQRAWNGYRTDRVTVYALLHFTSAQDDVALELDRSIWVVFSQSGAPDTLTAMALVDFATEAHVNPEPPEPPRPAPVDYQRGADGTPARPGYEVLRAMAEWAASLRDRVEYFVFPADGKGLFWPPTPEIPDTLNPGDIVVPGFTPTVPQNRPQPQGVWFQPTGKIDSMNLAREADAVFWSTAAMEEFLFPYYASRGGADALRELHNIFNTWEMDDSVTGLVHLPTSEWAEVDEEGNVVLVPNVLPRTQLGMVTNEHPKPVRADRFILSRGG